MGSPDPDGRQIDGVGGGISSLSKVAVVSVPHAEKYQRVLQRLGDAWAFPGIPWADDPARAGDPESGYDVVYRMGQVPINDGFRIDWTSTCGNFVSAAAVYAYRHFRQQLQPRVAAHVQATYGDASAAPTSLSFPLRVLLADSGKCVEAHMPLVRLDSDKWFLSREPDTAIAGVPGKAPGIRMQVPLDAPFPTGSVRNTLQLGAQRIDVSVVDTGLPVVFVPAHALGVSADQMALTAQQLDQDHALHERIEAVRQAAARLTPSLERGLCISAPKVVLVHPRRAYTSSGGEKLRAEDMDVLVRGVSVGNFHRSIMATALSSVVVASAYADSVVAEAVAQGGSAPCPTSKAHATDERLHALTIGQPAGLTTAMVRLDAPHGTPTAVVYDRTARRVLSGAAEIMPFPELVEARGTYERAASAVGASS